MDAIYGLMGLVSDDNPLSTLISYSQRAEALGLARLNLYFSNKLFPGINTLMPNLVYCYLILAVLKAAENTEDINDPLKDSELNEILSLITVGFEMTDERNGFHGLVQENVFAHYRAFLRRYDFINKDDRLTDTSRSGKFKRVGSLNDMIESIIKENIVRDKALKWDDKIEKIREIISGLKNLKENNPPYLLPDERLDMQKRILKKVGIVIDDNKTEKYNKKSPKNKDFITKIHFKRYKKGEGLSLFEYILFRQCVFIKNEKNFYIHKTDISKFFFEGDELADSLFYNNHLEHKDGTNYPSSSFGDEKRQTDLRRVYLTARFVSVMELYLKQHCNRMLNFVKKQMIDDPILNSEALREIIEKAFEKDGECSYEDMKAKVFPKSISEEDKKFILDLADGKKDPLDDMDEICEKDLRFLIGLFKCDNSSAADDKILEHYPQYTNPDYYITAERITEYVDTFRWEYRPLNDDNREVGKITKCASYFMEEVLSDEK